MHKSSILVAMLTAWLLLFSSPLFALDLQSAKQQGLVRETPSGYLKAVKPSSEVKALVSSVNAGRKQHYSRISKKTGAPLKTVEQQAGAKLTK
ncbi:MAG TPA: DUF1318 domain-containing protein [Gammaproteobacteria bacterium]|nr:DUF1318 domain-containing protein [Gammaproteobacteria bacterium]